MGNGKIIIELKRLRHCEGSLAVYGDGGKIFVPEKYHPFWDWFFSEELRYYKDARLRQIALRAGSEEDKAELERLETYLRQFIVECCDEKWYKTGKIDFYVGEDTGEKLEERMEKIDKELENWNQKFNKFSFQSEESEMLRSYNPPEEIADHLIVRMPYKLMIQTLVVLPPDVRIHIIPHMSCEEHHVLYDLKQYVERPFSLTDCVRALSIWKPLLKEYYEKEESLYTVEARQFKCDEALYHCRGIWYVGGFSELIEKHLKKHYETR